MKCVFLDIDGVLNTKRTALANGGIARPSLPESYFRLDEVACKFLERLVVDYDVQIVLSSSWRLNANVDVLSGVITKEEGAFDVTSIGLNRDDEITAYLNIHSVSEYVILDDIDFGWSSENRKHFVRIDGSEGISYANMLKIRELLNVN